MPHGVHIVDDFLEVEDICRVNWLSKSADHNTVEHIWDGLARALAQRNLSP